MFTSSIPAAYQNNECVNLLKNQWFKAADKYLTILNLKNWAKK